MTLDEKLESVKSTMTKHGPLPISLDLSKAEHIVLSQWVANLSAAMYDKGFADGSNNR